eukprot:m.85086 g.85086  ORF g.85086 m.85086 type:complete len:126 (+) comp36426_c0_seq2:96-473(+)
MDSWVILVVAILVVALFKFLSNSEEINLHGRRVDEVRDVLLQHIESCPRRLLQQIRSLFGFGRSIVLITGRGSHSPDGLSRLKPEVMRLATKWRDEGRFNCIAETVPNNPGRLRWFFLNYKEHDQ